MGRLPPLFVACVNAAPRPVLPSFSQSSTVIGEPIYADQIKTIHYLSNATAGVNAACVAAQSAGYEWVCNMASNVYPYITSPFFALNSHTDSWQTE